MFLHENSARLFKTLNFALTILSYYPRCTPQRRYVVKHLKNTHYWINHNNRIHTAADVTEDLENNRSASLNLRLLLSPLLVVFLTNTYTDIALWKQHCQKINLLKN